MLEWRLTLSLGGGGDTSREGVVVYYCKGCLLVVGRLVALVMVEEYDGRLM